MKREERITNWARRTFLQAGTLAGLGLGLGSVASARPLKPTAPGGSRAKACILLFATGGPSQHDTFDPKPDADSSVRGEFDPIATNVPGIQICEHLPRLAR